MPKKKKNFWYWAGQAALGLGSIAVTFSDNILGASFPEHTWVNQMAIPIGAGVKLLWDRVLYQKNALPGKLTNKVYDKVPNAFTGLRGSRLTSGTITAVELARFASDSDTTVGALYIEKTHYCFTIEDQYQSTKVAGETRIPAGVYRLGFRTSNSSMNEKYKEKFPDFHVGMIEILGIPNFTDVYVHIGNDDDDTAGCVLPNNRLILRTDGKLDGEDSTSSYERFYKKVTPMMQDKDTYIRIYDKDIKL